MKNSESEEKFREKLMRKDLYSNVLSYNSMRSDIYSKARHQAVTETVITESEVDN